MRLQRWKLVIALGSLLVIASACSEEQSPGTEKTGDAKSSTQQRSDPISGKWKITGERVTDSTMNLKLSGESVTGELIYEYNKQSHPLTGSWKDNKLTVAWESLGSTATMNGTLDGDKLSGDMIWSGATLKWEAKKTG